MLKKVISFSLRYIPRKYLQLVSHWAMKVAAFWYKGDKVECPVCASKFSQFLPYGRLVSRDNALCPNCLALERHRLMYLFLKEKTNFFTQKHKLLHIAPEYCFIDRFEKLPNLEYITADIESPLAKVKMDLHAIPFAEGSYDVVFCNHVMEHVDDYMQCMREIHRVLRPGGWAIIQSPQDWSRATTFEDPSIIDPAERERIFWQNDHLRLFGRDYGQVLQKAGFKVTEDKFVQEMPKSKAERFALPLEEIIYFCEK